MAVTRYSFRFPEGPAEVEKGADTTISVLVEYGGSDATISGATLTAYDSEGATVLSAVVATVSGGEVSYTIPPATTASLTLGSGWRFIWSVTISGVVYTARNSGALVKYPYQPVIGQSDLERLSRDFADADLLPAGLTSYQQYIDEAASQIRTRLLQQDRRPWLIVDPWALRSAHLYLTAALITEDFITLLEGSKWESVAERFRARYDQEWDRITFGYDTDQDGEGDSTSSAAIGTVWVNGRRTEPWGTW